MALNQKIAWANIATASLWLVALLVLFISGGTAVFWETDTMRLAFLLINMVASLSASGLRAFVARTAYSKKGKMEVIIDERDRRIRRNADIKAGIWGFHLFVSVCWPFSFTASMPVEPSPLIPCSSPLLAGALTYLFSQGIYTLVLCNRKINSDEE